MLSLSTSLLTLSLGLRVPADILTSIGGFSFNWTFSTQSLKISTNASSSPIWSTIPNEPFVSTSFGYDSFSTASGNWNITTSDAGLCTTQSVNKVHATDAAFSISGSLGGSPNCSSVKYTLQFSIAAGLEDRLAFNINLISTSGDVDVSRSILIYRTKDDEDFYGFGEQASFSTMKNQVFPIFSREGGVGRGDQPITSLLNGNASISGAFAGGSEFTSYTAIPQYVTTENNLFYLTGTAFAQFNFTRGSAASVRYSEATMQGHLTQGDGMLDAISKYSSYAGKQPRLPTWADNGAIMGIQGGEAKVEGILQNSSNYDCPTVGVWLQDWCGTLQQPEAYFNISRLWWNWESDSTLYPNWTHWVGHLNSTYNEIVKLHVWATGVSGFMSDFGEYQTIQDTIMNNSHTDPFLYHNLYPAEWARLQREVITELSLENEALVFHRSAGISSSRYMNVFWVGDQNLNWARNDGIKSVITSTFSLGFSGIGATHSDIGGYTNSLSSVVNITRSPELLGRWGELGALSGAIFRSHEGNIPNVNAQFYSNASTFTYYAYNARMFASLAPYRRRILDHEVAAKGWPLVRHPVIDHPNDAKLRNVTYEAFYLGAKVYVAPVLDLGMSEVSVYLPHNKDGWLHVWSNATYGGGVNVTVAAPLGKPGVFLKLSRESGDGLNEFMKFVETANATRLVV